MKTQRMRLQNNFDPNVKSKEVKLCINLLSKTVATLIFSQIIVKKRFGWYKTQ